VRRVGPGGPGRDGLHRGDRLASQPGRVEGSGPRPRGLHPLLVEEDGSARQEALGGGVHVFPQSFFLTALWPASRFPASPSARSVCSTPGMSHEASIGTTSLSSTSWTAATVMRWRKGLEWLSLRPLPYQVGSFHATCAIVAVDVSWGVHGCVRGGVADGSRVGSQHDRRGDTHPTTVPHE
jgi:hypothetical protein